MAVTRPAKQTGQGWRCLADGCPTAAQWQFPLPPLTPAEAFDRHRRINHPDRKARP